ncbi:helix-turn-helix domain-containing protein [Sphingomonas sp. LY54]|uniref:helix-turn-helix domain-containing protein n=1 Tax=Sphingomonas sp. LY54 TaxID=3095343 RepID=UPI002D78579D|nr:helix-turn-helix domain-containing protein [Sphingomonas sp. LY54]WRP28224.1 helix-turn-helix domain-containing protein [Sphingomonas sp. LY54]
MAEIEAAAIDHALLVCGSRAAAAQALGIGRSTIYRKVEQIFGREGCPPLLFGEPEQLPARTAGDIRSSLDGCAIEPR